MKSSDSQTHGYGRSHRNGAQIVGHAKDELQSQGLDDEVLAATERAGDLAVSTMSEVGCRNPGSIANGQLASAILIASLLKHDALAQDIDWDAIRETMTSVAAEVTASAAEVAVATEPDDPLAATMVLGLS